MQPSGYLKSLASQFEHYVTKHQRWLTFIGAFIVFVTFITKEGLSDRWRDTAEQMNSARAEYFMEVDRDTNAERHREIMQRLNDVLGSVIRGNTANTADSIRLAVSKLADPSFQLSEYQAECTRAFARIKSDLAITEPLAEKLPANNPLHSKLDGFYEEFRKASLESMALTKGIKEAGMQHKISLSTPLPTIEIDIPTWEYVSADPRTKLELAPKVGKTVVELYHSFLYSLIELQHDVVQARLVGLSEAEVIRRRDERLATLAWWFSMFLFTVGWGLGLLGKLYGAPEAESGG